MLPLESTGPLEKSAGHECLVEAFRARTLHPMDDSAELAAHLMAQLSNAGHSQHEVSQVKILASMNSSEHRLPQDGRIRISENGAGIDLRISIIPSQFGESVVIRVLARTADMRSLDAIGFESADLARLRDLLRRSMGIVLVTGPTGSGKTTTLYAALQEVVRQNVNIITVEDPIEYELENVIQIQVNPAIDFSFPKALRHILRHDPDMILIGEMRDYETAKIAVESALTGHLVFSTLHTNDAPSALVRLIEMGVEPYLIRSAVIGVLAQRLARNNCAHCRAIEPVDTLMRTNLDLGPEEVFWYGAVSLAEIYRACM